MSDAVQFPIQSGTRDRVVVSGSFAPNGSGAVASASNRGSDKLWTVAQTAAGTWTVTFTNAYNALDTAIMTIQHVTAVDLTPQVGAYNATAKTLVLRANAGATPTNIAADANSRVHFTCVFRNTLVTP